VNATLPRHITKTFYTHTYSNTNVHHIDQNIFRQTTNRTHQTTSCSPTAIAILPMRITETFYTHPHIHALPDINQIICIVNYKSINLNGIGSELCMHVVRPTSLVSNTHARRMALTARVSRMGPRRAMLPTSIWSNTYGASMLWGCGENLVARHYAAGRGKQGRHGRGCCCAVESRAGRR
jgi:hypothetical protein